MFFFTDYYCQRIAVTFAVIIKPLRQRCSTYTWLRDRPFLPVCLPVISGMVCVSGGADPVKILGKLGKVATAHHPMREISLQAVLWQNYFFNFGVNGALCGISSCFIFRRLFGKFCSGGLKLGGYLVSDLERQSWGIGHCVHWIIFLSK